MYTMQAKTHNSGSPAAKTAEPTPKAASSGTPTRLPAWTSAWGDNPPVGLLLSDTMPTLQAKLTVNQPGDAYEQEADQVADQVMRMPDSAVSVQGKCACGATSGQDGGCEECTNKRLTLQRLPTTHTRPSTAPPIVNAVLNGGGGRPLDSTTWAFMEPRFGYDFSNVRVHTDTQAAESARAVNALAYTVGRDIVFGRGQYAPETTEGRKLLAHELTHVVQQRVLPMPMISRKIDMVALSGCSVVLGMRIGIYGPRATPALATRWQNWINTLWNGTAACHRNSAGACATRVSATVTAHPTINWWWNVPESNSAFVREPGYDTVTNTLIDGGDWAEDEDDRSIAHEVGHLMGQPDYYWARLPFMGQRSESGFVNDIMANYYQDPGPTEYGPALTRILEDHDIDCLCCLKYPPCGVNNCALNPGLPCTVVGERRHCEWIRANNTPEALANYHIDCSTLAH